MEETMSKLGSIQVPVVSRSYAVAVFVLTLYSLVALPTGMAQTLARLTGTVTDSSGSAIVGAKLILVDVSTGVPYETTSGGAGTYTFPLVLKGTYKLTCEF